MSENKTNETPAYISEEHKEITEWLKSVKFKKKSFGGIDEADVWKKIEELNTLYEKLLIAERAKQKETEESANDE